MALPALAADYLFVGPLIKSRLEQTVAGFPVDVVETVDQVLAADRRAHVLMVMWAGDNFGDVASVRSRIVVQRWLVLLAFNNVGAAAAARQVKAGPVMSQVHTSLAGWKPEGAVHSLRRANAAMRPGFPAGKALYPLGFELELSL